MIGIGRHCPDIKRRSDATAGTASTGLGLALIILTSCSGGGGSSGTASLKTNPNASFLNPIAEPSSPAAAGDWSGSQEYVNSTGLDQLKAAEGYARRSGGLPGGQGVRIAIIDSGIDVTHPDLGNLAGTSWSAAGEDLVGNSHATFVAGIAGASRTQSGDPNDIHGMAYRATLMNFQSARPSDTAANGFVSFRTDDLVDAIHAASGLVQDYLAMESDVLNLSLGALSNNENTFAKLREAMRDAADEDKIMVLAAGNEGLSGDPDDRLQPIYPAAYADDSGIAGYAIVVGNLTSSNTAAASSNLCGDTKDYCLFAPGTSIRSTLNGGGYGIGSGTSFAAPYVAGAAAVVKAAFPGVSSQDVVNRLLLTAADLGDPGVDSTFGRGRLDLEAAMTPVGPTGLPIGPTVDGPVINLAESALHLGPGFAVSKSGAKLLARAITVDEMGFPFPIDLGDAVSPTKREHGIETFISGGPASLATAGTSQTHVAALIAEDDVSDAATRPSATAFASGSENYAPPLLRFSADITRHARMFASLNTSNRAKFGPAAGLAELGAFFLQADAFFSPQGASSGRSAVAGASVSLTESTEMAFSLSASMPDESRPETSQQRAELRQALPGEVDISIGLELLQEDGGFAGSRSSGAFGDDMSARSQFLTISLIGPVTDDIDWFTTYSRGRSAIGKTTSTPLIDWSGTRSEAFGAGLVLRDMAKDGDGLTVMIGQPLRQEHAKATIELPVARQPDGTVVTARERVDFAPEAREISTEVGYRLPIGQDDGHDIEAVGFLRFNPDHDPDRSPEAGLGLAYRWRF